MFTSPALRTLIQSGKTTLSYPPLKSTEAELQSKSLFEGEIFPSSSALIWFRKTERGRLITLPGVPLRRVFRVRLISTQTNSLRCEHPRQSINSFQLVLEHKAVRLWQTAAVEMLAEGTGLEPACPFGRRFSRPLHYQLCDPSAFGNYSLARPTSQLTPAAGTTFSTPLMCSG